MMDIAAQATKGVHLPTRKRTRLEIVDTFKRELTKIRDRLHVSYLP